MRVSRQDLREITKNCQQSTINEMAVPSYLHWNPVVRWLFWKRLRLVQEICQNLRVSTALDFGTGTGVMLPFLAQISSRVVAVDREIGPAVNLCSKYALRNVELQRVEALRIELSDESVDLILCLDVLEHVEALPDIARELARILARGGLLILSGPSENFIYRLGRLIAGFQKIAHYHRRNADDVNRCLAYYLSLQRQDLILPYLCFFKITVFIKAECS